MTEKFIHRGKRSLESSVDHLNEAIADLTYISTERYQEQNKGYTNDKGELVLGRNKTYKVLVSDPDLYTKVQELKHMTQGIEEILAFLNKAAN